MVIAPPTFPLRPYQEAGQAAVEAAYQRGINRQVVVWPTGAGKTVLFSSVINRRGGRSLILAHRDELLNQAADKLRVIAPDMGVGVVKAQLDETDAQVVLASVQTLARQNRLARLTVDFATAVVDEAHHAPADSYQRVINHVMAGGVPQLLLGVTATPDRLDRLGLSPTFQEIVHQVGLIELMAQGYLVDIHAKRIGIGVDFDDVRVRGGDFVERDLAEALENANAPEHIAAAYAEHARDRCGVVFVPSVELAYATAAQLRGQGFAASALDGSTPTDARRDMLEGLSDGTIQVLVNCMVLTEGFDEPRVDCIVVARPTESRALYQQQIGRGLRPYPGKADCLILDLVGNGTRHELVTVSTLFGLDPDALEEDGLLAAERDEAERRQKAGMHIEGDLVASTIDLFDRRDLQWVKVGQASVLALGDEGYVGIEPARGGTWRVLVHDGKEWHARLRQTHTELPFNFAVGIAEELARTKVPRALRDPRAPWRRQVPSQGQLDFYQRRGWAPPATKGEASERMTDYFATHAWRLARR